MKQTAKTIVLLVIFVILSMLAYPLVHNLWATLYIPLGLHLPRIRLVRQAWLAIGAVSGSVICAGFFAWPLGYWAKEKPLILGAALGVIPTAIFTYRFDRFVQFDRFIGPIFVTEHVSFVVACIVFARWGSRVATKAG